MDRWNHRWIESWINGIMDRWKLGSLIDRIMNRWILRDEIMKRQNHGQMEPLKASRIYEQME